MENLTLETPLGPFHLAATAQGISYASFVAPTPTADASLGQSTSTQEPSVRNADERAAEAHLENAREQLTAYFAGTRRDFELNYDQRGTPFQKLVWAELARIPYGETISYRQLAERVGKPGASRAVGAANGRNPLCILVPCHRVIAADGGLGGYTGGVPFKEKLLSLENPARDAAEPKIGKDRAEPA